MSNERTTAELGKAIADKLAEADAAKIDESARNMAHAAVIGVGVGPIPRPSLPSAGGVKARRTYEPLTEKRIEEWRETLTGHMGIGSPTEANILCDMAINALLYVEEIYRLRHDNERAMANHNADLNATSAASASARNDVLNDVAARLDNEDCFFAAEIVRTMRDQ